MEMPCDCPICGDIHELNDAKKCLECGKLYCPGCAPKGICVLCREAEEVPE